MNIKDKTIVTVVVDTVIHIIKQLGRLDLLPQIVSSLREQAKLRQDTAYATTPSELSDKEKDKLRKVVRAKFGDKTTVEFNVDPSLIGGYIIHFQDMVIDQSAKGQLQQIRKSLA